MYAASVDVDKFDIDKKTFNIGFENTNEFNFNTPIILLTKNSDVEYSNEYKKIWYNYYLLKPIKKENLNDILDEYIK